MMLKNLWYFAAWRKITSNCREPLYMITFNAVISKPAKAISKFICSLESLNYSSRTNKFEWNPFSSFGSVSLVLELIDYTSYMRNLLTWAKFFFYYTCILLGVLKTNTISAKRNEPNCNFEISLFLLTCMPCPFLFCSKHCFNFLNLLVPCSHIVSVLVLLLSTHLVSTQSWILIYMFDVLMQSFARTE